MIQTFAAYYKPHLKLFCADMLCVLALAACNLFYPMITRSIINEYVPERNLKLLLIWSGALLDIYVLKMGLNFFITYQGHVMGVKMQVDMRKNAFDHLLALPFSFMTRPKPEPSCPA